MYPVSILEILAKAWSDETVLLAEKSGAFTSKKLDIPKYLPASHMFGILGLLWYPISFCTF